MSVEVNHKFTYPTTIYVQDVLSESAQIETKEKA